jgi:Holliday junction DNA helicase RuvA
MITRITGHLESIEEHRAHLALEGGLVYEVLLPTFAAVRLGGSVGQTVTLHTVHYLEGSGQGNHFIPRLAGFLSVADRQFFELFTTVKGIGARKGLRALGLETGQVAGAIADRDVKLLQSLPEIGKRMAETIVATLHGKVDAFVSGAVYGDEAGGGEAASPRGGAAREALEVLMQLGETRSQAVAWIDQVMAGDSEIEDSEQLIAAVLRLKAGA